MAEKINELSELKHLLNVAFKEIAMLHAKQKPMFVALRLLAIKTMPEKEAIEFLDMFKSNLKSEFKRSEKLIADVVEDKHLVFNYQQENQAYFDFLDDEF